MIRSLCGPMLALAVLLLGRDAHAEEGTLVAIESGDLVLDVGKNAGVERGEVVELWRPVKFKQPGTGKVLADRIKIGTLKITEVENVLSLASIEQSSQRAPQTGDIVVFPKAAKRVEEKPVLASAAATPPPATKYNPAAQGGAAPAKTEVVVQHDPEEAAVADLLTRVRGMDREKRILSFRAFLSANPKNRFAPVLLEEIAALEAASTQEPATEPAIYAPIDRLRPGTPQRFAIELDKHYVGAVVHVKARGATAYRSIPMESLGERYWAATLPGDAIAEPAMDYFVEGTRDDGVVHALVGTPAQPKDATVEARPLSGKREGTLATLAVSSEIASFNVKKANDYLFQTEGAFGWRLGDLGIRAVRSGFGVLRGKGGSLEDLETLHKDPRDVGLTYGWLEAEFGIAHGFSLIGRPILGLREEGMTGGAQAFFRIGNDLETNLLLGGEALGAVGLRGVVELQWKTIPRVPILLRSEVTNQPAGIGGDIGARAIAQVGYELVKDLAVSVRGSYQGRTINHAGPGAGGGVSYQW